MKHSSFHSFNATISELDAETLPLNVKTSAFVQRSFDAETTALDAEMSAIAQSYRRYRRRVSADIGDCGVGITPQTCLEKVLISA